MCLRSGHFTSVIFQDGVDDTITNSHNYTYGSPIVSGIEFRSRVLVRNQYLL